MYQMGAWDVIKCECVLSMAAPVAAARSISSGIAGLLSNCERLSLFVQTWSMIEWKKWHLCADRCGWHSSMFGKRIFVFIRNNVLHNQIDEWWWWKNLEWLRTTRNILFRHQVSSISCAVRYLLMEIIILYDILIHYSSCLCTQNSAVHLSYGHPAASNMHICMICKCHFSVCPVFVPNFPMKIPRLKSSPIMVCIPTHFHRLADKAAGVKTCTLNISQHVIYLIGPEAFVLRIEW